MSRSGMPLIESHRADGAAERVRADGASDAGDRVVRRPERASGGQVSGVLKNGEHLAALQLPVDLRSGNADTGILSIRSSL